MMRGLVWLTALVPLLAIVAALLPRERVGPWRSTGAAALGADPVAYIAASEARYDDIVPGAEKRIVWAGTAGQSTDWAVVYVHGFSASAGEIRPVPQDVARALGANLFLTRLAGHGRGGDAMAGPDAGDWLSDYAEAVAIGAAIGRRVLVIATSTGATIATLAATEPGMPRPDALVLVSPNYGLANWAAGLLTWPLARYWVPLLAGAERGFAPVNAGHAQVWTTRYPTVATLPMAALVAQARRRDPVAIDIPALVLFSDADTVVRPQATRSVVERWGGPMTLEPVTLGPGDDPARHVIAGDILSPGQTRPTTIRIVTWVRGLD